MKKHYGAFIAIGLLVLVVMACTTANISELKFSKDQSGDPAATTFNTGEDIYAVATVSNTSEKLKLTWKITYDNVKGKDKGESVGEKTMDFEGSKELWQQFSTPLPGEYKVEATLTDESGKKLDSKTGMVTVKGSGPSAPSSSDKKKNEDDD